MQIKLNWKLFGILYLIVFVTHVLQVFLLGSGVSDTVGVIQYLAFSPLATFAKYSAYILIGYLIYDIIRSSRQK